MPNVRLCSILHVLVLVSLSATGGVHPYTDCTAASKISVQKQELNVDSVMCNV